MSEAAALGPAAPVHGPPRDEVVIRPPRPWPGIGFADLREYRELLFFLTKRDVQIRYKQSLFGLGWAILQPLAYAFLFSLVFGRLVKVPSEGVPYPIFALAALVPWIFVSASVTQSAASLVSDANLLSKVYFPRLVLPLGRIGALLLDLMLSLGVLALFIVIYGAHPTIGVVALPGFIALAVLTAVGAGTLLSAVNVQFRDVAVAVPLLIQLWLFATPVIYPGTLISGNWQYVYALNPVVAVIEGFRWALLGTTAPTVAVVAISVTSAVVLSVVGIVYFRRTERHFADVA